MEKTSYNHLVRIALILTIAFIAWSVYDGALRENVLGESAYHAANKYFEDRKYDDALQSYYKSINNNSDFIHAHRGIARSLMQLDRHEEALNKFNEVIAREPEFGASYANRGILNDRMGNYEAAINDYKKAIALNPKLAEGPSWLTRFLRNQANKPPTLLDRLNYLQEEMKKPKDKRILNIPEEDDQQRPYKL